MRKAVPMIFFAAAAGILLMTACAAKPEPADLVLFNGTFLTESAAKPEARAVVVTGDRITAVCDTDDDARRYVGDATRVIDLGGKFAVPGLTDAHIHFNQAGALIIGPNLLAVSDEAGLRAEIGRVAALLGEGEWITEGLWGAYEQWAVGDQGDASRAKKTPWRPNRAMIDDLTPAHPCFLNRFDSKEWLANSAALKAAGLENGAARRLGDGEKTESRPGSFSGRLRLSIKSGPPGRRNPPSGFSTKAGQP